MTTELIGIPKATTPVIPKLEKTVKLDLDMTMQTHEPFSKTNDEWSEKEDADLTKVKLPKIPNWKLLVQPIRLKEKTKGGIILSSKSRTDIESFTNIGRVIAVGDSAYKDERFGGKAWCKVGDYIIFSRHTGQRFKWKGYRLVLLPDDKVDLVIENPDDFDDTTDAVDFD